MNCHFEVAVFLPFGVENNFLFSSCFLHPFFPFTVLSDSIFFNRLRNDLSASFSQG